eukprot:1717699-Alexandrium_andersonii.AAC.1
MVPVCPMCRLPAPGDGGAAVGTAEVIEVSPGTGGRTGEPLAPSPMDEDEEEGLDVPMEWDVPPPPLDPAGWAWPHEPG